MDPTTTSIDSVNAQIPLSVLVVLTLGPPVFNLIRHPYNHHGFSSLRPTRYLYLVQQPTHFDESGTRKPKWRGEQIPSRPGYRRYRRRGTVHHYIGCNHRPLCSETAEETQVVDGRRRQPQRTAQRRRGQRTPQGFLQGSLEEIVGGQTQSVVFWTPWCVLLDLFLPRGSARNVDSCE